MSLIALLGFLIVLGLIYYCAHRIIAAFGLPGFVAAIVDVFLAIAAVLWLLQWAGASVPGLRL